MKKYIAPTTDTITLRTEPSMLSTSNIPVGGGTDHFDTRRQFPWEDYTSEEDYD